MVYPEDAVSVRAPGCVWASGAGRHGFVSSRADLPARHLGRERHAVRATDELHRSLVRRRALTTADSELYAEQLFTALLDRAVQAGLLVHEPDPEARGAVAAGRDFLATHRTGGRR